ncbi:MAG: ThiF family adenylyltransferase [Thermoleophilia bacterium]|nr:ThiF family adenylyltransferase [Thermoleophilia bacterium]
MTAGAGRTPCGLTDEQRRRYSRHLAIPELGEEGQARLAAASVLVVGLGGLGSPVALYLAAAGVGRLGLVDMDVVETSNLQRQVLHFTDDVGRPKTASAAAKLAALNPEVELVPHQVRFSRETAAALVDAYDVVVTAVDNFPARFLLNDVCVLRRRTLVEAAILRFTGLAMTVRGGETACYRCVFPEMPEDDAAGSPAAAGVFGPLAGLMGCVQACEVVKVLTGAGSPLYGRLLQVDVAAMSFHEVAVDRDPGCPVCGERPRITGLAAAGT